MSKRITAKDMEEIQKLYSEGKSVRGISLLTGWSQHSVEKMIWPKEDIDEKPESAAKSSAYLIEIRRRINQIMRERSAAGKPKQKPKHITKTIPADQIPRGYIW